MFTQKLSVNMVISDDDSYISKWRGQSIFDSLP